MLTALFYFLYFATIGIFIPYWTLFLRDLNLAPIQISVVFAIPSAMRAFAPTIYGYVADRLQVRKPLLVIACFAQIIPFAVLLRWDTFPWLIVMMISFSFFNAPVLPFAEATVMEEQSSGRMDYGRTRLWGSISFILATVILGRILDEYGNVWILYGLIGTFLCLAFLSFGLPENQWKVAYPSGRIKVLLKRKNIWVLLLCVLLMQISHGTFYAFYSIHLTDLGVPEAGVGVQWAIAAASEISIFFFASRILKTFSLRRLFSICLALASVRWFLSYATTSYWWLAAIQCLHAFSFGLFHVTTLELIQRIFPPGLRSFGQSVYTSVSWGIGATSGMLLTGLLWRRLNAQAFVVSGVIALVGLLISLSITRELEEESL